MSKMSKGIVETLYSLDGDTPKRKIIDMKRVMRGALSISRSASGDEVFRCNQFENIGLKQSLRLLDRAMNQSRNSHNSKRRTVLRHWSLVFEKQKSMNESIRELDSVLHEALEDRKFMVSGKTKEQREIEEAEIARQKALEELQRQQEEQPQEIEPTTKSMDPAQIRALMLKKKTAGAKKADGPTATVLLPKIDFGDTDLKIEVELDPEEPREKEDIWPLKDTTWINNYVKDERIRHDELVTRNILKTIQEGLTRHHTFYRFRLRGQLSDDPLEVLKTTSAKSRPATRSKRPLPFKSSTAHSTLVPRLCDSPRIKAQTGKSVTIIEPDTSRSSIPVYTARKEVIQNTASGEMETVPLHSSRGPREKKTVLPSLLRSKTMF